MKVRLAAFALLLALPALAELHHEMRENARRRIEQDRPQNVVIDSLMFDGAKVVLQGHTPNPNAAANFIENIKNDSTFTHPKFSYLRKCESSDPPLYEFEFRFSIREQK